MIKIDKAANWRLYTNTAPAGFEMLGVIKNGWEVCGALAKNKKTGIYVAVNAYVIQSLPQQAVAKALADE